MAYPYRRQLSFTFGGPLTPAVKYLIIANVVVFTLEILFPVLKVWLGLYPPAVLGGLQIWRLVTWLFIHGGIGHILFNMLFLFMFGCQLERLWGTRFFTHYYFVCGIGAGLFTFLPIPAFFYANHIGASGAIYGVLLAYGMTFPRNLIYVWLLFPIEARYFVLILGVIAFWGSMMGGGGVSHIAHLGGLAAGYLYLRLGSRRRSTRPIHVSSSSLRDAYRRWRVKRLRKKFEEYYQKRGGGTHYDVH